MARAHIGPDAAHALGSLIGRRVTLRHRVDHPGSGGTSSDAVGELVSADAREVVVHTRRGPVRVATAAVVAVREIPPAPVRRASWAAVSRLEGICADAWPAPEDRPLGQWRLRAAGGFSGRANSCLAVGDPGRPIPDALARAREFATAHGLPPRVQVPEDSPWHSAVAGQGWLPDEDHAAGWRVDVLVSELGSRPDADPAAGTRITIEGRERWRVAAVEPVSEAQEYVLSAPGLPHLGFAVARSGAELIGSVRLAVLDEHLYVARLEVADEHRRRGLATALMAAAESWAQARGARWCVLQVADSNSAALRLYEGLGYRRHHRYRYLRPAD